METTLGNLIKSESQFTFKFDGGSEIEAVLLSRAIVNIADLIKIAAMYECPNDYVKIKVTSLRSGSFQINFSTVSEAMSHLYRSFEDVSALALKIVGIVLGFFKIKKHLKGKKPKTITEKSEGMIEVENEASQKIIVHAGSGTIINNIKADVLVIQISECALEHNPDGGFTIATESEQAKILPDDLESLSAPIAVDEERTEKYIVTTELPIRKPDLLKNTSWQFIYQGKSINAKILDENFLESVNNGSVNLKSGSYIRANLEITVYLDINGAPLNNAVKYNVIEVIGSIEHYEMEQLTIQD